MSVNTVADAMRRQGLQGRKPKRRKGTTKQDKDRAEVPGSAETRVHRAGGEVKWCGDMTEIPTADEGKLYLAILDLFSRKLRASPTAEHRDAELVGDAGSAAPNLFAPDPAKLVVLPCPGAGVASNGPQ